MISQEFIPGAMNHSRIWLRSIGAVI